VLAERLLRGLEHSLNLDFGASIYNILHLAHNIYINKNVDLV